MSDLDYIAIIGMSCRLPKSKNPEDFWKLLLGGIDGISEVPANRWNIDDYYDPNPDAPGKMMTRNAGFMEDVDLFDAEFFGISPREAAEMDPQQRLALEVTWEALERAGIAPESLENSKTGVFIGVTISDYSALVQRASYDKYETYTALGTSLNAINGRISFKLGLLGPSLAVDTACSSSLVSLHLACESLRKGECDLAIGGGTNLLLSPSVFIMLSRAKMLSPDGHCKTFDASGDGYARGEGVGIVILKRLQDAIKDHDKILAVIRSSAVNQDGASSGLTVPNGVAQALLIEEALKKGNLSPLDISYVEAHGTGTSLGDPIEVGAIEEVYGKGRKEPLLLGSAKSNIGHLEGAAGIASLIKVVLSLQNEVLPPNLHFKTLNPKIPLDSIPAKIITTPTPWKGNQRAGISSFGFTGTNAHLIVEKAPVRKKSDESSSEQTLVLSAKSEEVLERIFKQYEEFLATTKESLADICYTAYTGRNREKFVVQFKAKSREELLEKIKKRDLIKGNIKNLSFDENVCKVLLPTYPFEHKSYWSEAATLVQPKSEWFYEWVFEKQKLENKTSLKQGKWLIFAQNESYSENLLKLFSGKGELITEKPHPKFFTEDVVGIIGISPHRTLSDSSENYLLLAQAVIESKKVIPFWFITHQSEINYLDGPINGLHKSFVQEYPEVPFVHIDDDRESIDLLFNEFHAAQADEKFVSLKKGQRYVGRLKFRDLSIPQEIDLSKKLDPQGSYLITGGLGGLGIEIAKKLIQNGATDVILSSRRIPEKAPLEKVSIIQADVGNRDSVKTLISHIEKEHKPLKGIFHLAGVLDDKAFMKQTIESFEKVFLPKVYGSFYLHEITLEKNISLDLFVFFSSTAATMGNPGQTNYAAANSFMDSLAAYRRNLGLAGQSLSWGPWAEVGMAADLASRHHKLGLEGIKPEFGMKVLAFAIVNDLGSLSVTKINWPLYLKSMKTVPKWLSYFKEYQPIEKEAVVTFDEVQGEKLGDFIKSSILKITKNILDLQQVNEEKSFFDMGMDSLMAIEFRNQLLTLTAGKVNLSNNAVYDFPTVQKLSEHIFSFYKDKVEQKKLLYPIDFYSEAAISEAFTVPKNKGKFPPEKLLLTGITGHLGSYLLHKTAKNFPDAKIYCLVRAKTEDDGLNRIRESLASRNLDIESYKDRLRVVLGDLAEKNLGITHYDQLSQEIDLIIHCGAQTNWSYSYDMLRPANVLGTYEVIKFAMTHTEKPIHHISTIGVLPYFQTEEYKVIHENFDILHKSPLVLPYGQSKWVSEMQMRHARERGLRVNIYRPGQIVCDLEKGTPAWNEYSYRLVEGCRELKLAPKEGLDIFMSPVDVVAEIVTTIASSDEKLDRNFHITHSQTTPLKTILEGLNEGIEFIETHEWIEKVKTQSKNPVIPVLDLFIVSLEHDITQKTNEHTVEAIKGIPFPTDVNLIINAYLRGLQNEKIKKSL